MRNSTKYRVAINRARLYGTWRCLRVPGVCLPDYKRVLRALAWLICITLASKTLPVWAGDTEKQSVKRGEYVYHMAGCGSCHTDEDGKDLGPAGNVPLDTPFGTFYSPNITPDKATGIGGWTDRQFVAALRNGVSPKGVHYFPAFPYTSYTRMHVQDLLDLKAYLDALPPVEKLSRNHDLSFPFNQRWLMGFWKALFFEQEPLQQNTSRSESWNRGAYIVNGPGHCVECHTPRNLLGGLKHDALLAGNPDGPEGGSVPAIDPEASEAFRQWSADDIVFSLQTGMLPDGDFLGGSMGHVIENSTSRLNDRDLQAIAEYLQSPDVQSDHGIFSSMFGMTDAVAEQDDAMEHGQGIRLHDAFMWLIWLIPLGGVAWLVMRIYAKKRAASDASANGGEGGSAG